MSVATPTNAHPAYTPDSQQRASSPSFPTRVSVALARRAMLAAARGRVVSGPFRGMRWTHAAPMPYILGTHELELVPWVERIVAMQPDRFVNVGAADGYFTTGLALRLPAASVVAFEMDDAARAKCASTVAANGVADRVSLRGACAAPALAAALEGAERPLVVLDIEGGEVEVLDPVAVPALARATILVETHDLMRAGCASTMRQRFGASHDIESVWSRPRTARDFPHDFVPWLQRVAPRRCGDFVYEDRGAGQEWLLMSPRA